MPAPGDDTALRVTSDLVFSLDGPGGPARGTVTGSGALLRVVVDDPRAALDASGVGSGVRLDGMADRLAAVGLTVEVDGPRGTIVRAGAGVDSTLGRIFAGTRALRVVDARQAWPLARAARSRVVTLVGVTAVSVAGLAAGVAVALRRRASRR